jgi:sulfatase maturation enzyme AslB (radical SAM superfamily)
MRKDNYAAQSGESPRAVAVFYPTAVCNLRCRYCGIDKNPILQQIDDTLGESFEGDYYFNQLLKYFPEPYQLKKVETWGGEPFIHMERMHPLLHKIIQRYPYFDSMFSSTNFSYPQWLDKFFGLMEQFEQYAPRKFEYVLQLSLDGPENINDMNRGEGVTKKCLANLDALLEQLPTRLPKNVTLVMHFKGTLDNTSIAQLDSKEKIIEYFRFYDELYDKMMAVADTMPNLITNPTIPNTAVPSPVTKADGLAFAELCKNCREIERENLTQNYFKRYKQITPYSGDVPPPCQFCEIRSTSLLCGTGSQLLGFLPQNMISVCHEGFTQLYSEYKDFAAKSNRVNEGTINFNQYIAEKGSSILCMTEDDYLEYEKFISNFRKEGTTARLVNTTTQILALAMAGEIDEQYLDIENANHAAIFLQNQTAYCIKDNLNVTGSLYLQPLGIPKLLLNGAREHIELGGPGDNEQCCCFTS